MAEVFKCAHNEIVPLSKLVANPKNPNNHPKKQIELLAKIIDYQGQRSPIVVSKRSGFVTKGHGRLAAITSLSWANAAVDYQEYDSEAQEYADMIADNKIAELAEHDDAKMILDIPGIPDLNLEMLGMIDFKMPEVFEPQCDEDAIPEHVEPKTKLGDIYQLGNHRLMCGDSTSIDAVEKLMNGEKADVTITSPPYNAALAPGVSGSHKKYLDLESDKKTDDEYSDFLCSFHAISKTISNMQAINLQFLQGGKRGIIDWLNKSKENYIDQLIWLKPNSTPGPRNTISLKHEHIFLFSNEINPNKHLKNVEFPFFESVICISKNNKNEFSDIHSAGFPVELPEKIFEITCPIKGSVYEPFGGTGTTLIACEKTNRKCFMMELEPHYCDVIIARWEKYTVKKAELLS